MNHADKVSASDFFNTLLESLQACGALDELAVSLPEDKAPAGVRGVGGAPPGLVEGEIWYGIVPKKT